jgi:NAD(P)-dependent dehydrogenase (short-subunit alcohol dehydrogenase family)
MSERAQGKRVLVTGAGTGIGRGVAIEFAAQGAEVALHYSHSDAGARSAVQEIRDAGGRAEAFRADFDNLAEVKRLSEQAVEFLGGLDVLINNAGITTNAPFEEITPEQFDLLYNVNVRSPMFLTQYCLPALEAAAPSAVINLTSMHAYHGMTEHAIYAGTKGAIVSYTRQLAVELAQRGVRVNAIAPGWIWVENHRKVLGDDFDMEAVGRSIPAGFLGEPRDVAHLAVFLASDEARFIIGYTYVIDGGQMCIMPNSGDFRQRRDYTFGQGYVPGV